MTYVTEAYLIGIREGRDYLNRFRPTIMEMRDLLLNLNTLLKQRFSNEVAEMMRGERDFWKNQLKKINMRAS